MQKHIFQKLQIFVFYIYIYIYIYKNIQNILEYWPYATHKNNFYIFLCQKTQTSQLITIKVKKPHIIQIFKALINQLLNPNKICKNIFLHFHKKYNMILFIPKILDHIQIKTLNFYLFDFYNSTTYIKKKKYKQTHISFYYVFLIHPYIITNNKQKFKIKQPSHK